jgi:hypothetical protein
VPVFVAPRQLAGRRVARDLHSLESERGLG